MELNYKINKIKSPLSVQFELTYSCNNKCLFCYNVNKSPDAENNDIHNEYKTLMSYEQICKIIDKLADADVFDLVFTGGEPTLHPDFLRILEYSVKKGFTGSFITNANSMTKELARDIAALGIRGAQISLHGSTAELHDKLTLTKGAFDKAMKGIDYLLSEGIGLNMNMTVCKDNMHDILNTAALAKKVGMMSFSMTRFVAGGDGLVNNKVIGLVKEDLEPIIEQIELIDKEVGIDLSILTPIPLCSVSKPEVVMNRMSRCDQGISWCAISPAGKVRLCTTSQDTAGDLNTQSIEEIWQKDSSFIRCQSLEHIPDECKDCSGFQFCGGGCRAAALNCTGEHKGKESSCSVENIGQLNEHFSDILKKMPKQNAAKNSYSTNVSLLLQKPFINKNVIRFREESGGILAFDGKRSSMFNKDTKEIFDLCDKTRTLAEIIETLGAKFNMPVEELKPIVTDIVVQSSNMEIIEWEEHNFDDLEKKLQ